MTNPTYYCIPTPAGTAELASALAAQQTVPFTHLAIGDGNGNAVIPDGRTDLVHQVDIVQISSIRKHPVHPNWIVIEAAIPENHGGYFVREIAVIGGRTAGTILAVGNHPAIEKPAADSGAGTTMIVRTIVAFEQGSAAISLAVDPMAYATLQTVLDQIAVHEAKLDPHPQYLTKAEGDLAYDQYGAAVSAASSLLASHSSSSDPHPQYLTKPEGDLAYASANAIETHISDANPHNQYLTKAESKNTWAEQFFYAVGI